MIQVVVIVGCCEWRVGCVIGRCELSGRLFNVRVVNGRPVTTFSCVGCWLVSLSGRLCPPHPRRIRTLAGTMEEGTLLSDLVSMTQVVVIVGCRAVVQLV